MDVGLGGRVEVRVRVGVTVGVKLLVGGRVQAGVLVGRCRCETKSTL